MESWGKREVEKGRKILVIVLIPQIKLIVPDA